MFFFLEEVEEEVERCRRRASSSSSSLSFSRSLSLSLPLLHFFFSSYLLCLPYSWSCVCERVGGGDEAVRVGEKG